MKDSLTPSLVSSPTCVVDAQLGAPVVSVTAVAHKTLQRQEADMPHVLFRLLHGRLLVKVVPLWCLKPLAERGRNSGAARRAGYKFGSRQLGGV